METQMISTPNMTRTRHDQDYPRRLRRRRNHSSLDALLNSRLLKSKLLLIATCVTILIVYEQLASTTISLLKPAHCLLQNNHHHHSSQRLTAASSLSGGGSPCHPGWHNIGQKCYKIVYSPRNLEGARSKCHELFSELVTIEDVQSGHNVNKEEESDGGTSTPRAVHNNNPSNLIATLTSHIKPDMMKKDRPFSPFYVNISSDLLKQYNQDASSRLAAAQSADPSEHIDSTDYTMSELWISHEDSQFASMRFNHSESRSDMMTPGFALVKSELNGWGLLPILPTRKAPFFCEKTPSPPNVAIGGDARHHASRTTHQGPKVFSEHHQTIDPKRSDSADSNIGRSVSSSSSSSLPAINLQDTSTNSRRTINSEREVPNHSATTATPNTAVVQDAPTSALFRDIPQNQSIVMGSSSEMRCSPIENDSSLTWTVNGRNLTQSNRIRLHASGTLRIDHVRNTDGGNYTCTIQSGGLIESHSARLEILERPHQPEYINAELLDKLSTSVRVTWTPGFNGNSPIIKYLVEMRTVASDNIDSELTKLQMESSNQWEIAKANISADQTSVIVPDLKPARKYIFRIKAANRIGTSEPSLPTRKPIEVPVQPPSSAPEKLAGTPKSSNSISVGWLPPPADSQNGAIKSYKIQHRLAGYESENEWYTTDVPETAHHNFILDDLITWQNYEIRVAAENDKGIGPWSESIRVQTKEGKPDKGPRDLSADALSSSMIKVTWKSPPPQHINGINLGYRVQLWLDAAQTQLAKEVTVAHNPSADEGMQATKVDSLAPYTDYHVTVKCFTNAGDGVANEQDVVVKTKQDLPEAVQSLEFAEVLDKSLRVVWQAPKRPNGELNQYTLEYWESAQEKRKISKTYPPGMSEARILDLTPQTAYTFKIYAHTDVGPGASREAQVKTSVPPVLPEPPSNLVPLYIGPYSVTIQFEPGFDGNAALEKWIAEALTPSMGDYKPRWQTVYISSNHTHGSKSVIVRNLRPFTRYKIRLTPVNIAGQSRYPSEATAEFQTSQIEPELPPRDLSIEEIKSNSALARWSPLGVTNWSGNPRGYNLTWAESNNSTVSYLMINDTRADSYLVRDLEEFTEYTFRIHAVNEAGSSPPSEPVVITTLEDVPSSGPTNVTARALTSKSVSVDWSAVPKRHRNGLIRGYKIQYQSQRPNAALQYKSVEENNTRHVILNDLKPFTTYHLAVAAYTSQGDGVYGPIVHVQTLEDTPGLPQNVSSPTVSPNGARILWDPPEDTNGDILGYKIAYYPLTEDSHQSQHPGGGGGSKDVVSQELQHNERTFKAENLRADTHYVFTVTAKTKEGWGQQASTLVYTHDSESRANLPFYKQGWFVLMCACLSFVITIIVIALLAIQTKSYKYKQNALKSTTSQDRLGDAGFTIDDDPAGHYNTAFGLLSNGAHSHRRSNGAISQSTANFTLPKTPPRPHPGSVVYSDDDDDDGDDDVFEDNISKPVQVMKKSVAGTSHYDTSSGDSVTEKPSEISSSPAPESESADDEYVNMANRHFVNHYANVNGTLRSQRSWKRSGTSMNKGAGASTSAKHYASTTHRGTKPKMPQRPAPSVPQVPHIDHSQSSSDNGQPIAGTSGMQQQIMTNGRSTNGGGGGGGGSIYGETFAKVSGHQTQHYQHHQLPTSSNHTLISASQLQMNGNGVGSIPSSDSTSNNNETYPKMEQTNKNTQYQASKQQQQQQQQQIDLLNNNHLVSLNGGRVIVDNIAGSRAPLPGFTSFV